MYVEFEKGLKYAKNLDQISENHESFKDAGWILTDDEYVVDVDVLSKDVIKKLLITFDIKTQTVWTERGVHLYFKKPDSFRRGANRISPLGFAYEIKHKGNTKAVTIKRNGKLREIEHEGIREDAPFIFNSSTKFANMLGMQEGEGRNEVLFKLRARLQGVKEWRKILSFVNENIFAEPLNEQEFLAISREMSLTAEKGGEHQVATWLMSKLDFLEYGGRYYFKHEGGYNHEATILRKIVFKHVGEQNTRYVDEVIKQMQYRCQKIKQDTVFDIKLKNGYLRDGKFVDMVIDDFTPYTIDINYNQDAKKVKCVDDYLNHLTKNDEEYKTLLLEVLGHTLVVNPEFKRLLAKFFIFIGEGGNGKGTLLQIIKNILGTENVTGMSIKELSDERYLTAFKGKLANLGDDLQDQAIDDKDMKILKNLTTCDYIATRELYKQAENMNFTGSLIFTSNHLIKSFEKGKSYKRRVMWLPMFTKIEKKDPHFITKLTTDESLEYWIKLIVEGYMRLYEQKGLTVSAIVEEYNKVYHEENNPYLLYLQSTRPEDFIGKPVVDVSNDCSDWCEDNDIKYSKKMFYETLKEVHRVSNSGVDKKHGKTVRIFESIE